MSEPFADDTPQNTGNAGINDPFGGDAVAAMMGQTVDETPLALSTDAPPAPAPVEVDAETAARQRANAAAEAAYAAEMAKLAPQPAPSPVRVDAPAPRRVGVNIGKNDELSTALANQRRVTAPLPERPQPPGRFVLEYAYNGQAIRETHRTVRHALASYHRLRRLGITPETSTLAA